MSGWQELPEDVLWELYGPFEIFESFDEVPEDIPLNHVWTIVEGSDSETLYAMPGYHKVNNVMWVESDKPWTDEQTTGVWYDPLDWVDEQG